MTTPPDFWSTASSIFNAFWPALAIVTGLILGSMIVQRTIKEIRGAFDVDDSTDEVINRLLKEQAEFRQLFEKRKNDEPEEKEKPTAWQLGDDGEMVPVIEKPRNNDLYHPN